MTEQTIQEQLIDLYQQLLNLNERVTATERSIHRLIFKLENTRFDLEKLTHHSTSH